MEINKAINNARKILMEYWPLNAFIATNPIWQWRNKSFLDAIMHSRIQSILPVDYYYERYREGAITKHDLSIAIKKIENRLINQNELETWINESLQKNIITKPKLLLSEQIEEYNFQQPKAWIKERLFSILRDYFGLQIYKELDLLRFWHQQEKCKPLRLDVLEKMTIEEGIYFLSQQLKLPNEILSDYLEAIYLEVYGWSSLMNWRNQHPNNPWIPGQDACEAILLIWLAYEHTIHTETKINYQHLSQMDIAEINKQAIKTSYLWHTAFESHYINELSKKLNLTFDTQAKQSDAQFIFCIDTRSEGFRRQLETEGNIETFGFAGFFGAIFNLTSHESISYQAPALVSAAHNTRAKIKINQLEHIANTFKKIISYAKKQFAAPFALFEMAGIWFLPFMLFKTIQPSLKNIKKNKRIIINNPFSPEEKLQAATNLLKSIGLTKNFSPYVFICAHQSDTINNPFQSALNCGACGGNSGIPNALVMCDILNDTAVREALKAQEINIPKNTIFIPACHHTGNDRLDILGAKIPNNLQSSIERAAENLRNEKARTLPGKDSLQKREKNWSELIPELGLINNAAIIIGPRKLTLNQNLERRTFLHSYEPSLDPNGEILTNILSAPAIVAHWINSQYYFSTVNPDQFGAGNKAIHNVLPGVGVLEGNLSDLKVGLPLQSTHFKSKPIHEPRRITVVVYAKKNILDIAINNSPEFKKLLDNEWIFLKQVDAKISSVQETESDAVAMG